MKLLMLPRYDRMGASSRYRLMQYVPLFERAGHAVEVWPLLDDEYIRALYVTGRRPVTSLLTGYLRRLERMRRVKDFDAVICEQEAFPYLPDFFELLLRRPASRLFVDYDDAAYVRYEQIAFLKTKIAHLMSWADDVVAGNRHLASYAQQFAKRVTIIPSVVDLAKYRVQQNARDASVVCVGWIGTPITAELLKPLLPVFVRLQSRFPRVVFRFIGAGDGLQTRELRYETPSWSEESEGPLLAECDLGIMPLPDTEFARGKCGLKLVQYMACGLPVVASPVGVNGEIVDHEKSGFLASTASEWEEALGYLIANRELRCRMGLAARQRVESEYTLEHGFARWMEVLAGNQGPTAIRKTSAASQGDLALAS
jgi:glycosyltransferase involved in cell wall biosynthesis